MLPEPLSFSQELSGFIYPLLNKEESIKIQDSFKEFLFKGKEKINQVYKVLQVAKYLYWNIPVWTQCHVQANIFKIFLRLTRFQVTRG